IKYPIILGGMASLGTAELVSAVSNAGGLGVIGSGSAPSDWLREQIHTTKKWTDKPFGVNLLLLSPFLQENLKIVIEEKVKVVTLGGGIPGVHVPALKEAGIIVMPVISSVALARRLERQHVDALVVEGMESGGHVGDTTTLALLPQVIDVVSVPVVAAGGIADGKGLVAALAYGAQGIQMGTRFICSDECIAHQNFKEQIVKAQDRATIVTGQSMGHPVRCLENKFTREFKAMENTGIPAEKMEEFGMGRLYSGVIQGNIEEGSLMAGQISGYIKDIKPVKEIIENIMSEAETIIEKLAKYKQ
ncbi:MAG: nitronate monooxygenase, partial [Dehalococcoidia bacterium]